MWHLPASPATPATGPLAPVYTFATSTGGDPTLLIIAGVVVAGSVLLLAVLALEWVRGYRIHKARWHTRRHESATGREAAEAAMAAAFPQAPRVVQAPAPRREVTVGGRA